MSSNKVSPSKDSKSPESPVDKLSMGILTQFSSLKDLEVQLEQITANQENLIQNIAGMNVDLMHSEEIMEVQLMMKKLNLYRLKLKKIKSEMLYIRSTSQSLLQKAIEIQDVKVNEKAEKIRKIDYEMSLVGRPKGAPS